MVCSLDTVFGRSQLYWRLLRDRSQPSSVAFVIIASVTIITAFVKVRQGITNVLQDDFGYGLAKVEAADFDRTNQLRQCDVLKALVNKFSDLLSESVSIWTSGQCVPIDVY